MNLRFVEAFHWVATLKSVTRAAEKLFLTQSAVSSRIAALEESARAAAEAVPAAAAGNGGAAGADAAAAAPGRVAFLAKPFSVDTLIAQMHGADDRLEPKRRVAGSAILPQR